MELSNHFPVNLYQSYIIEGEPNVLAYEILRFLENRGDIKKNSEDTLCEIYDSFFIDDSRVIKEWHNNKKVSQDKRICVIAAKFLNREAEQTLLKILEEPQEQTHFFIILPNISSLSGTILSRSHTVKLGEETNIETQKLIDKFIKTNIKDRLDIVADIIKNKKDEDSSSVLRSYALSFINEIEKRIYEKFKNDKSNENLLKVLEQIHESRSYLNSQGASVKMILENLALMI